MNNFFKVATAIAMTAPFTGAIAAENTDIAAKLQQLESIVQQQQAEINALRGQAAPNRALVADLVQEELDARLDSRIQEGLAAIKESGTLSLGAGIDGIKLTGDARFRYNNVDMGAAGENDFYDARLRIGATWMNKSEDWEFGVGIEAGSFAGNESNYVYGAFPSVSFESQGLFLDYAYAAHHMDAFTLIVGQMHNPFVTTNMLWDEDVRPVGVGVSFADAGFFATAGVLLASESGADAEALLSAAQVGFKSDGEDANYTVALGYWHSNSEVTNDAGLPVNYDFQIVDVLGKFNTTAGDVGLGIWGHYAVNVGAEGAVGTGQAGAGIVPDDEDQAYAIGITASLDKFSAGYTYKHIEADAAVAALADNEFGTILGSTNVEGHEISLGYALTNSVSIGARALLAESIVGAGDSDTYQLDLNYKF
jgi:hypothetical protein